MRSLSLINRDNKGIWICLCKENDFIKLEIEDNGLGFPQDRLNSLTTPYFSLIPKGTGLGLAIVKKIIQDHKGKLIFENSSHDSGAKVTIVLPTFINKKAEVKK